MRFYIQSLGCPKNEVDGEGMQVALELAGHEAVDEPAEADLLIVNTCGFIQPAIAESIDALRALAAQRREGQRVVAAGCLVQREGAGLAERVEGVDALLGTLRWREIVDLVDDLESGRAATPRLGWPPRGIDGPVARSLGPSRSAYVRISEGCSAGCGFCVIPQIKGRFRSRPREAVLAEIEALQEKGAQEVILIGQNTTAYGSDRGREEGLAGLLEEIVERAPSIPWVRVMYAYPTQVTPGLIGAIRAHPQICHYLDMPLQHAHPAVLGRMGRPGDPEGFLEIIARLRQAVPDIALRTTFIVGFPGETEEEFESLLEFIGLARFDRLGVFRYSREAGTRAAEMPYQAPEEVKAERYERAMAAQQLISLERNEARVGGTVEVLVEGCGDGMSVGRSYRDAPEIDGLVLACGERPIGEFAKVRITGASPYDLWGEIG